METTFHRYKAILGSAMRARGLASQRVEVRLGPHPRTNAVVRVCAPAASAMSHMLREKLSQVQPRAITLDGRGDSTVRSGGAHGHRPTQMRWRDLTHGDDVRGGRTVAAAGVAGCAGRRRSEA